MYQRWVVFPRHKNACCKDLPLPQIWWPLSAGEKIDKNLFAICRHGHASHGWLTSYWTRSCFFLFCTVLEVLHLKRSLHPLRHPPLPCFLSPASLDSKHFFPIPYFFQIMTLLPGTQRSGNYSPQVNSSLLFVSDILGTQPYSFLYMLSRATFEQQQQCWGFETEPYDLQSLKYLLSCLSQKKVCWALHYPKLTQFSELSPPQVSPSSIPATVVTSAQNFIPAPSDSSS